MIVWHVIITCLVKHAYSIFLLISIKNHYQRYWKTFNTLECSCYNITYHYFIPIFVIYITGIYFSLFFYLFLILLFLKEKYFISNVMFNVYIFKVVSYMPLYICFFVEQYKNIVNVSTQYYSIKNKIKTISKIFVFIYFLLENGYVIKCVSCVKCIWWKYNI